MGASDVAHRLVDRARFGPRVASAGTFDLRSALKGESCAGSSEEIVCGRKPDDEAGRLRTLAEQFVPAPVLATIGLGRAPSESKATSLCSLTAHRAIVCCSSSGPRFSRCGSRREPVAPRPSPRRTYSAQRCGSRLSSHLADHRWLAAGSWTSPSVSARIAASGTEPIGTRGRVAGTRPSAGARANRPTSVPRSRAMRPGCASCHAGTLADDNGQRATVASTARPAWSRRRERA